MKNTSSQGRGTSGKQSLKALALIRYNWPLYLFMTTVALACISAALIENLDHTWRILAGIIAAGAIWYIVASSTAFYWLFDRSNLLSGEWLSELISKEPTRWVQLSVCLEETTLPIQSLYPSSEGMLLDLFNLESMPAPAINRARKLHRELNIEPVKPSDLKIASEWSELTIVTLVAHELRESWNRDQLFEELQRITSHNGRILIVEHLRNLPAALAFGPGMFHFYPRNVWLNHFEKAGLVMEREMNITSFAHAFILRNPASAC